MELLSILSEQPEKDIVITDFEKESNLAKILNLLSEPKNLKQFLIHIFWPSSLINYTRKLNKLGYYDLLYEQNLDPQMERIKNYISCGFWETVRLGVYGLAIYQGIKALF